MSCTCHAGTIKGRCAYCGAARRRPTAQPRDPAWRDVLGANVDPRGTAVERINNAIVALDFAATGAPNVSAGVRQAVRQLAQHWVRFFRAGAYWTLPDPVWFAKLGRYVDWYARAYVLLPATVQAQAPAPDAIDPAFAELVHDSLRRIVEADVAAASGAAQLIRETTDGLFNFGLLWLALGGLALWKIYASSPRFAADDGE